MVCIGDLLINTEVFMEKCRMSFLTRTLDRMNPERKSLIFNKANKLYQKHKSIKKEIV